MPAVSYIGKGAFVSGTTGTITPTLPAGVAVGDILLLVAGTAAQNDALNGPAFPTWSQLAVFDNGGTPGAAGATGCRVWWRRVDGTDTAPAITGSTNYKTAQIHAFRSVRGGNQQATQNTVISAISAIVSGTGTSAELPGVDGGVCDGAMAVSILALDRDAGSTAEVAAWSNAALASLTELHDQTVNTATGGGFAIASGGWSGSGSCGTTSATLTAQAWAGIQLILKSTNFSISAVGGAKAGAKTALRANIASPLAIKAGAQFGKTIGISADGRTLAIGAPEATAAGFTQCGSLFIYEWDGTTYQNTLSVSIPAGFNGQSGQKLGNSLALSGDGQVLHVSAITTGGGFPTGPRSLTYRKNGSSWGFQISQGDSIGLASYSLTHDGGARHVGSPTFFANGTGGVYKQSESAAGNGLYIGASYSYYEYAPNAGQGVDVSINATTAAVSCAQTTAVRIWDIGPSSATLSATITPPDASAGRITVGLSPYSDALYIGAESNTYGGATEAGEVYKYTKVGSEWILASRFGAPTPASNAKFGKPAIGEHGFAIGEHGHANEGRVFVWWAVGADTEYTPGASGNTWEATATGGAIASGSAATSIPLTMIFIGAGGAIASGSAGVAIGAPSVIASGGCFASGKSRTLLQWQPAPADAVDLVTVTINGQPVKALQVAIRMTADETTATVTAVGDHVGAAGNMTINVVKTIDGQPVFTHQSINLPVTSASRSGDRTTLTASAAGALISGSFEPAQIQMIGSGVVRAAPDFRVTPGCRYQGSVIRSVVTTLGVNSPWFTEVRF